MNDDYYIGSAREVDGNFSIELNVTKLTKLLERPQITLALKSFFGKGVDGEKLEQTAIMLHVTELPPEQKNPYRTHSVSINARYRQNKKG
jgi:hypothetical protein